MILSRDETFRVVCNFRTQSTENEVVGTGIFMSTKNNEPWLITAAHVALSTNINTIIAISDSDSNCITLPLVELNSSLSWKYHSVADLAALPIFISGHSTMSDTTGGKSAIVTPTYYLKDLIPFK